MAVGDRRLTIRRAPWRTALILGSSCFVLLACQRPRAQKDHFMDPAPIGLKELAGRFYRPSFSFKEAYDLLGPLDEEKEDRILLKPRAESGMEKVTLEKLSADPAAPPFLAGI